MDSLAKTISNETAALNFFPSDYLLVDCQSGDPNRTVNCIVSTVLGIISGSILPFFIITGILGNFFIVHINLWIQSVWSRQNVYISMIALIDNCNIIMSGFKVFFLEMGLPWLSGGRYAVFITMVSEMSCKIVNYFDYLFLHTSCCLNLLMVADRALSMILPFKFKNIKGKSAMKASLTVVLICVIVTVPQGVLFHWIHIDNHVYCYLDNMQGWRNILYAYYTLLLYYPPSLILLLILIGDIILIHQVRKIVNSRKNIAFQAASNNAPTSNKDSLAKTVVCLILSGVLLIASIPVLVSVMVETFLIENNPLLDVIIQKLIWLINYIGISFIIMIQASKWVFLVWKNAKFRHQCLDFLRCKPLSS